MPDQAIQRFLASPTVAVIGASEATGSFGGFAFRALRKSGRTVYPVNPARSTIDGVPCLRTVADLPAEVRTVITVVPPAVTETVVEQCIERGVTTLWMQQGSSSPRAIARAREAGLDVVHDRCIMLFLEPVRGGHALHRWFSRLTGRYPR